MIGWGGEMSTKGASGSAVAQYERMVETKPAGAAKYRSLKRDLDVFGARDLYEFVAPSGIANPRAASSETLVGSAEERVNDFGRMTTERSAAERLRARARDIFGDAEERERYDEYLRWLEVKSLMAELGDAAEGVPAHVAKSVASVKRRLADAVGSDQLAQDLIDGYDAKNGGVISAVLNSGVVDEGVSRGPQPQGQADRKPSGPAASMPSRRGAGGYTTPLQQDLSGIDVVECPHCGNSTRTGDAFCAECGRPLGPHAPVVDVAQSWPVAPAAKSRFDQQVAYVPHGQEDARDSRWPVAVIAISVLVIFLGALCIGFMLSGKLGAISPHLPDNVVFAETNIVPVGGGGNAIKSYKVVIRETGDSNSEPIARKQFANSGFSIKGFQDEGLNIETGLHCLEITIDDRMYTATIDYRSGPADQKQAYEIKCQ